MNKEDIKIGKKVWYYPIRGGIKSKEATITSETYDICGTICCFINICSSVVNIKNLEERMPTPQTLNLNHGERLADNEVLKRLKEEME